MTDQPNPYAAPGADLTPDGGDANIQGIKQVPRFTTWGVFGLSLITLGFYFYYWLYTRTKIINSQLQEDKIDMWMPTTILIVFVVNFVVSIVNEIPRGFDPNAPFNAIDGITTLMGLGGTVIYIILIFGFRKRINIITNSREGDQYWLGGVGSGLLTFFFSALYFQYKINEIHDEA